MIEALNNISSLAVSINSLIPDYYRQKTKAVKNVTQKKI